MSTADAAQPAEAPRRPVPHPTPLSQPFWDACAEGRLLYQLSPDGEAVFPPRAFAPASLLPELEWAESKGEGSVYSYSVVGRPQTPAFDVPYIVAIVELDEGYEMLTNLVDCDPAVVETGMRVVVDFREVAPGTVLPFFAPADPSLRQRPAD